jgi:hypothetical protein
VDVPRGDPGGVAVHCLRNNSRSQTRPG